MTAQVNLIEGITVGSYGTPIIFQVIDNDGNLVDVSAFTTSITITARDPFGIKILTFTGSFVTSGVDGKVQFTPTVNNTFDREGMWDAQCVFLSASAKQKTYPFNIEVLEGIGT